MHYYWPLSLIVSPSPSFLAAHNLALHATHIDSLKNLLGGDEEIAKLEARRKAAQDRLNAAVTDEDKAAAQLELDEASQMLDKAQSADKALLAAQIARSEQLMSSMMNDWKGKFDSMNEILESRKMALKNEGRAVAIESEHPHFVSLNLDDPLATGIVLYYVNEGATTVGRQGADPEPDIVLPHDDVEELHCVVDYDNTTVMITPKNDAMLLVNGVRVTEPTELHQGSTVQLGYSTMLRFNHPVEAARLRQARMNGKEATGAATGDVKRWGH